MSRYRLEKLSVGGPPHGFVIHAPDDHTMYDTNPQSIVRELNRLLDRIKRLEEAGDKLASHHLIAVTTFDKAKSHVAEWYKAKEVKP